MTSSRIRLGTSLAVLALTGTALAGDDVSPTEIEFSIVGGAGTYAESESDYCNIGEFVDSFDQLPLQTSCFSEAYVRGTGAEATVSAHLDAHNDEGLFFAELALHSQMGIIGNAEAGGQLEFSGYINFELTNDAEVEIVNRVNHTFYRNGIDFGVFNYSSGETTWLQDEGEGTFGYNPLTLEAGEYAIVINGWFYFDSYSGSARSDIESIEMEVHYSNNAGQPADLNADGKVDGGDLTILLDAYLTTDANADLNQDGLVDGFDLTILLGEWGWVAFLDPDVNGDGVVNWADYTLVLSGQNTTIPEYDLNRDGIVDQLDLDIVLDAMD